MIARYIVGFVALGHLMIGLGIGWDVGPVKYDPEQFFIRGKMVGKMEPGLEMLFPRLLGCLYASLAMGLFYAAFISTCHSIRTSLIPVLCYHFGAATDAMNLFRPDAGAINPDKLDPNEPIIGHSFFFTLSIISFVLAGAGDKKDKQR